MTMTRTVRLIESKRMYDTIAYKFTHVLKNDDGKPGIVVALEQWEDASEGQLTYGEYEITVRKID